MKLIDQLRAAIAAELDKRDAVQADLDSVLSGAEARGDGALTAEETAALNEKRSAIRAIDEALADKRAHLAELEDDDKRKAAASDARLRLPAFDGVVKSEPRTYRADNAQERSFFQDAYRSQFAHDRQAAERIERHQREWEVERRDITSGTLNGLVPPQYLLDQAATLARAMRPLADVVPSYPLPALGMSFVVTRVTTGTATAIQTSQNTAPAETDMVTTDLTVAVNTIMGVQDVSRQALERGPVTDQLIFNDLVSDYATRLDAQVVNGSGSNGQHTGYLNVASIGLQTYSATAFSTFMSKLNGNLNDVASNRFAPATVIILHPRRWHWALSQADTTGRPLVVPTVQSPWNASGIGQTEYGPGGFLAGLPVIVDANIPTNLGTSTNEDRVIVTRLQDAALWEGDLMTFSFEQFINPPATIRLAVAGYSAFTAGRYPTATSVMVGTGLVAPSF